MMAAVMTMMAAMAQPTPQFDQQKGKWGYVDASGKWVIKPKYDTAMAFEPSPLPTGDCRAMVYNDEKWSMIDTRGKNITGSHATITPDGGQLLIIGDKDKYRVVDYNGKSIIKDQMERVLPVRGGGGVFLRKELWGFFNRDGVVTVAPEYDAVTHCGNNLLKVLKLNAYGVVNGNGMTVLPCRFDNIDILSPAYIKTVEQGATGLMTVDGHYVIAPGKYTDMRLRSDGNIDIISGTKLGVADTQGNVLVAPGNYSAIDDGPGELFTLRDGNDTGYADRQGKVIIPVAYRQITRTADGLYIAAKADGKLTAYTLGGKEIVADCDMIGDRTEVTQHGTSTRRPMFIYRKGEKSGVADLTGSGVACEYDSIIGIVANKGLIKASSEGEICYVTTDGTMYAMNVREIDDTGLSQFTDDGKTGLINGDLEIVAKPVYDNVSHPDGSRFICADADGSVIALDYKGNVLWESGSVLYLYPFYDKSYTVINTTYDPAEYGVIDLDGNLVAEIKYKNYAEVKAALKKAGVTDADNLAHIKECIDDFTARLLEAITPAATINEVTVDHNYYNYGTKGMMIHVNFDVVHALSHDLEVVAWFFHDNSKSSKLIDRDRRYRTSDGQVSVGEPACPSYESSTYSDFKLFIPYNQLHLARRDSRYNLKFYVGVYDKTWKKMIGTSGYVYFNMGWN